MMYYWYRVGGDVGSEFIVKRKLTKKSVNTKAWFHPDTNNYSIWVHDHLMWVGANFHLFRTLTEQELFLTVL